MTTEPRFDYRVEPLGASHDRTAFHSGVPELDRYLHHQAGQDARRKVAAPFVMLDIGGAILGYYTLSAYSIQLGELPEPIARRLPRYPLLPATLLGRLAISSTCRGQNLGRFLLMDALHRSWKITSQVASVGVVVEALDQTARSFYLHHEFEPLQDHPNKLFLAMSTIEKAFKLT
ncbi:MAG: GNAT family N-acetyltransferase [Planctomycetota bacterium]